MDLTIVGRGFLELAHRILNDVDSSMLEFNDLARKMTGELTIARVPSAVRYFLPEAITVYHQRYCISTLLQLVDKTVLYGMKVEFNASARLCRCRALGCSS